MTLKRDLLNFANRLIGVSGLQLYRRGIDMDSVLGQVAARGHGVRSIIDLGAARGDWSRLALRHFPAARVVGVDPLAERQPYLERLQSANPRFEFALAAAGPDDGATVDIAVMPDLDASTVHGTGGAMRQVSVESVDGLVVRRGLQGPFLLKFDTHGFELPILESARETLAQAAVVVMEAYNFRHTAETLLFHEMIGHTKGLGFRVSHVVDVMNRPVAPIWWRLRLVWLVRTIQRPEILKRYPNIGIFFWHLALALAGIARYPGGLAAGGGGR